jgi:hypothetical protein
LTQKFNPDDYNTIPVYKELSSRYSIENPSNLLDRIQFLEDEKRSIRKELDDIKNQLEKEKQAHILQQGEMVKMQRAADRWLDDIEALEVILAKLDEERKQYKLEREARKFQDENQ